MSNVEISGLKSAYKHAEQCAYGANMSISAALVVDMANRIAELEKELSNQIMKKEHAFKREQYLIDENLELRRVTFREYNEEEFWIFQDDGEDYSESIVCPVVMSAKQFRRLMHLELGLKAHNLEQQAKGRLDGVAYALNKAFFEALKEQVK